MSEKIKYIKTENYIQPPEGMFVTLRKLLYQLNQIDCNDCDFLSYCQDFGKKIGDNNPFYDSGFCKVAMEVLELDYEDE
jgi:hypothetical protein